MGHDASGGLVSDTRIVADGSATTEAGDGFLPTPRPGVLADVVATGALALAAGVGVGPAALAAAAPALQRVFEMATEEHRWRRERAAAMFCVAAAHAGVTPAELAGLASSSPDRSHLAYTASSAAETSRYPHRVLALAEALARGLGSEDEALLDHEQQAVEALASIDRPHLYLMTRMSSPAPGTESARTSSPVSLVELEHLAGNYAESLPRLVATLVREGLVDNERVSVVAAGDGKPSPLYRHAGEYWRLSPFGLGVLTRLEQIGGLPPR